MISTASSRKLTALLPTALLAAGLAAAAPSSFAQAASGSDAAPAASAPVAAAPSSASPAPQASSPTSRRMAPRTDAQVEAHLKRLHTQLKITSAESQQWNALAAIIRDNEKEMNGLLEQRQQKGRSMTALDNLRSYEEITDAHAEGMKKLVPAFEQLYDVMPDAQKKVADAVFDQRVPAAPATSKAPAAKPSP